MDNKDLIISYELRISFKQSIFRSSFEEVQKLQEKRGGLIYRHTYNKKTKENKSEVVYA